MKPARILHAVHDTPQLPTELTLYAETRAIAKDTERWKRVHENDRYAVTVVFRNWRKGNG
jgi:hypothetical protein